MTTGKQEYDAYSAFLRAAIQRTWERKERVRFLALLLATREAWDVAWTSATTPEAGKKLLAGAAGVAAASVLIRIFLGGPIGLLLTGASAVSLVALYAKNHERIWALRERYEKMVGEYRGKFEQCRARFIDGKASREEMELMIDGLLARFVADIEKEPEPKAPKDGDDA